MEKMNTMKGISLKVKGKVKVFIDTKTEISSKVNGNMTKNTQGIIGIMMEVLFKANLVRDRCHME